MSSISNNNNTISKAKPTFNTIDSISNIAQGQGKLPPQSIEIEEAVLGAILLEKTAFEIVSDFLKPECFYVPANKLIFEAVQELNVDGQALDYLTVIEHLKKKGDLDKVGGMYYVVKLTNNVITAANVENHAKIILEKFIQRELIRISGEIIQTAFEDTTDVFDLLDFSENKVFEIANKYLKKDFERIDTALVKTLTRIELLKNKSNANEISGVHSGFNELDLITNGWQPTDLIILAARPSVGKTAFALNLAVNAVLNKLKVTGVGFFSLEMSNAQLTMRILSCVSGVKMAKISKGNIEEYEYQQIVHKGINILGNVPMFFDDSSALNIFELRAKARRMVNKHKVGLIIIDYLQLMSGMSNKNTNREQEISTISRSLKSLAKELNVPIIALSQLSRDVEKRSKDQKIPQLSDLRESGAIEQDADMVLFLYREDYYQHGEDTTVQNADSTGKVLLRVAKHRNGSLADIQLRAIFDIQKFEDWEQLGNKAYATKPFGKLPPNNEQSHYQTIKSNHQHTQDDPNVLNSEEFDNNDVTPF
ncbi:MAG: replicative DNA helicase [Alphaproteobacteria bacterium]|nr:replicative DNA helicase [Alphaproteobacteria bacterium]